LIDSIQKDHDYLLPSNSNIKERQDKPLEIKEICGFLRVDEFWSVEVRDIPHEVHQAALRSQVLESELTKARQEKEDLQKSYEKMLSFLTKDQREFLALEKKTMRGHTWSQETIDKAMTLRLSCGLRGYEALLQEGYPLPSSRTLRSRTEQSSFESGKLSVLSNKSNEVKPTVDKEV
jgi:hypothetical protein